MIITIKELANMTTEDLVALYDDIRTEVNTGDVCENEHEVVSYILNTVDDSCFNCDIECPSVDEFDIFLADIIAK